MPSPAVSVVIPTYNRQDRLQRVLAALAAQHDDEPFEVVVVSDGSTDGTNELLADSQRLPLPVLAVLQDNGGPAEARNAGWRAAGGELVLFLDDDVIPQPGFVTAHRRAHAEHGPRAVVIGPMLTPADAELSPWVAWEQAMLDKQYAMLRELPTAFYRNFYTGNASLARAELEAAGGFDTRFRRAEDVELAYRLDQRGLTFYYCDEARGLHYAERSFDSWMRTAYDYGRNDVVFVRAGQIEILGQIADNFANRHRLQRMIVAWLIPHPRLAGVAARLFRVVARAAAAVHLDVVTRQALSGLYGLLYHQGVADELGGSATFAAVIERRWTSPLLHRPPDGPPAADEGA